MISSVSVQRTVYQKKTIHVHTNQKPWINRKIHLQMMSKSVVFKSNNPEQNKKLIYDHRRAIKDAKWKFWTKLES